MPTDSSSAAPLPAPIDGHPAPSEADYEAIQAAVLETWRGRWFLSEYARRNRNADTALVLTAVERIEAAMRRDREAIAQDRFRLNIMEMAKAISRTKEEIAAIQPDPEHHGRIEEATEELDAIVAATERATSDILAAAEQVQEVAWTMREQGLDAGICDQLDGRATDIYTACSFQDLTGQRISKVVAAMRYLERRINAMIDIWSGDESGEDADHKPKKDPLVNGPARPGHGLDQADVDEMMSNETPAEAWEAAAASAPALTIETVPADLSTATAAVSSPAAEGAPQIVPPPEPEPAPPTSAALPTIDMTPPAPPQPELAPKPTRAPADPLAPVATMSEEEKIALFT